MSITTEGFSVDVTDFKCTAFCNLRVFNEGHQFNTSTGMVVSSNRFGMAIVASPNQLCLISMKNIRQLVGEFGIEKNTLTNFLRREIALDYSPNFMDLSCNEDNIAVAGTSNSKPFIAIYNLESLISQNSTSSLLCVELAASQGSYVIDLSWNPGVPNSLACCLSDGSLHMIELKNDITSPPQLYSLPPQSNTLCLSWSPKGKQIIVGSSNGSLIQYKPELKAVKQYLPPTDIVANVKPIKVKWISNFQFSVVYDFIDNTEEQPSLYILNTPKNAPVEFINFEQLVVMNSGQYRLNQYYTIFQQNWNILFVASSNCTEIGVMGVNNGNPWQCWMLETRPELPFRLDKQMYPLGISLDLSSQMRIKQISKSNEEIYLDPMPVLCVLSSDGVLFMYHIENQLPNCENICKAPLEVSDNIITQLFTSNSKIIGDQENEQVVSEVVEQVEVNAVDSTTENHNESVLASCLETSNVSYHDQSQLLDTPKISVVKPNVPISTATVFPPQNVPCPLNPPDQNTSTDEIANKVMLDEILEDVAIFQLQLDDVLKLSMNTNKLKVGDEKDKETLVKKWTSLDSFFKELNETNRSQWAESKALQKIVLDSIAWVEDSKSRLFFLKNPKYKCLLRNDSDEPFSKTLLDTIERTLYYIETQLTHVDDQMKARYDSYNPNNKEMKIPCLETIYKSLVVNTNIVNKLKEKVNYLCNSVEEIKYKTLKKLSLAPDIQNTSRLNESRDVGLSKLSEQLLKITLDKDSVSGINSYNIAKKYSVLSANQRALSNSKVIKLQEWLKDFKTRRTKINRTKYASVDISRPVCSTPLKLTPKQKIQENITFTPIVTKEYVSNLPQVPLSSLSIIKDCNADKHKVSEIKLPLISQPDLTQCTKPLFTSTIQQKSVVTSIPLTVGPVTSTLEAKYLPTSTSTPLWNPLDNVNAIKPATLNSVPNKFDFKGFSKDTVVFSSSNSNSLFENNVATINTSSKAPVNLSLKSSTTTPLNFNNPLNMVSTKSSLDIISGTTESKDKIPFNFTNVSATKVETTIASTNPTVAFNFAESLKNKMDNSKDSPLASFSFETPKPSLKPFETTNIFSGFNNEDKSKNKQETVPGKETPLATFNFNSKSDSSFSTFSFTASKDNISKTTASETKSIFTTTSATSVTASFNFALPIKTLSTMVSEPATISTVSSTFEVVKTTSVCTTASATTTNIKVTKVASHTSESPTPIISEPVTPESENAPTIPVTLNSAPIFEISSSNIPANETSVSSTITSIFGNSTSTITTASIFNTTTSETSTSISNMSLNTTTSVSSIFGAPTNITSTSSIFGNSTNTTSAPSIFGAPTNATTSSSIFGTTNPSTTSSIFGAPATTTTSSSIFGNSIKTTSSIFGAPTATTVSSIFGSAATTNTTGGFGSTIPTTSVFSPSGTSSSIFGSPSIPTSSTSIFGSGTTTSSSIFGSPAATSTTSSIFGSPSTTVASSGLFGSVAAAANQPSSFGQSLGFSSPGSAFGNMSLFGQQACSPSQPVNSFATPANPFAINKTPSNTSSLFSGQKAVFGQLPANTTNTSFGVSNTGFGASPSAGFGSPSMNSQSSNLGFGSPPVFGSMGTAYDMSKSSGFGQSPVFGGAATFGSTSPSQYTFGQNTTSPESGSFGFGSTAQQPSTAFASLAAQSNTPSFGNLAQNQNTGFASPSTVGFGSPQQTQQQQQQQQQQASPFKPQGATFGGSSFNSWR